MVIKIIPIRISEQHIFERYPLVPLADLEGVHEQELPRGIDRSMVFVHIKEH
jgi:hypothetical protein